MTLKKETLQKTHHFRPIGKNETLGDSYYGWLSTKKIKRSKYLNVSLDLKGLKTSSYKELDFYKLIKK